MSSDYEPVLGDAPFNKMSFGRVDHVSPLNRGQIHEGVDGITVELVQGINEDDFRKVTGMATRATIGIDPEAPVVDYQWDEMLKGGLQSALESQTLVFSISGISRTCTHQLVRSRKAAFHQQSQRASWMGDHPNVRMPWTISQNEKARKAFREAVKASWHAYQVACDADVAFQDARFGLLEATECYILAEFPVREWLNTFAYRGCVMFQHEIVFVFHEMRRVLLEAHPWLKPYALISCEKPQKCTWQGWEDPTDFCPLPWGTWDQRIYKPAEELRIKKEK